VALCQEVNMDNPNPYRFLYQDSVKESADYLKPHINKIIFLDDFIGENTCAFWYQYVVQAASVDGIHAEFGVFEGRNINKFSQINTDIKWYGFDSFYGLNEDWKGGLYAKGHFSLNGNPPQVNENVELVIGKFQDTLPKFLSEHSKPFAVINIDCDTYESTNYVLKTIGKERIVKGTIICFDEYLGYVGWEFNEFKAWQEFCKENNVQYEYIIVSNWAVAIKII